MSNYGWTTVPPPAEKLDFNQAMRDFSNMFPTLTHAEIESTLRRHNGSVDDTIDELLMLATNGGASTSSSVHWPPPPSYDAAVSDTVPSLAAHDPFALDVLPTHQSSAFTNAAFDYRDRSAYKPPLLGPLPDNFLRINGNEHHSSIMADSIDHYYDDSRNVQTQLTTQNNQAPYSSSTSSQRIKYNTSTNRYPVQSMQSWAPSHTYLGVMSVGHSRPSTSSQPRSTQRIYSAQETQDLKRQAKALKDLMTENQFQRAATNDPELAQYLDDEAIAIMMQNKEFMGMLKGDKEFMASIARDIETTPKKKGKKFNPKKYTDCEPVPDGPRVGKTPQSQRPDEPPLPVAPSFNAFDERCQETSNRSFSSGSLGQEHSTYDEFTTTSDPFPYTKYVPTPPSDDRTFKDKLANMSKTSKQKFALLARKFQKKTTGAKGMLGTPENSNYDGLLNNTPDEIYNDNEISWHQKYDQDRDKMYRSGYDQ